MREKKPLKKSSKNQNKNKIKQEQRQPKELNNTYSLENYRKSKSYDTNPYKNPYKNPYASTKPYNTSYKNPYDTGESIYKNPYVNVESSWQNPYKQENQKQENAHTHQKQAKVKLQHKLSKKQVARLKRKKKMMFIGRILATLSFIGFLVLGIVKIADAMSKPTVSYQTVKRGWIDNSVEHVGIIVREEKIVNALESGNVYYVTNEGQKVQKDGEVCYIGDTYRNEDLLREIEKIDHSIYSVQDRRSELSDYQVEVNLLNVTIQTQMKNFYTSYKNFNSTTPIYLLRKELERTIQTRTDIYASDISDRLGSLQESRIELLTQMKGATSTVLSEKAGIVSYRIDGFEELFNEEKLNEVNFEIYQKAIKTIEPSKPITQVNANDPLYKLVTDQAWKLITYLSKEEAVSYEKGSLYVLHFKDATTKNLPFKIVDKIEQEDKVKMIFETSEQMVQFLPYRKLSFTIGEDKAQGLKIPLSAIVEKNLLAIPKEYILFQNHLNGVLLQTDVGDLFTPVSIAYSEDEISYISQDVEARSSVLVGQSIKNPENGEIYTITNVSSIQGVYVVNSRYTEFKRISILLTNKDYAILDEAKSSVKAYDQMISNPKNINENELLKYMNIQNE
jgi:hypothetical protein